MKYYILCTNPRSGTHLLKDLLRENKCGFPEELFYYIETEKRIMTLNEFFQLGTVNGVFGMACQQFHFDDGMQRLKEMSGMQGAEDFQMLNTLFPNVQFIYLYRRNKVKQAISFVKAQRSGHFSLKDNPKFGEYTEKDITDSIKFICKCEARWENFFERYNLRPHTLTYEALCSNKTKVIKDILDFLRIDNDLDIYTETSRQVQYDETSANWYRRYTK